MTSRVRASILALTFAAIVAIPSVAAAQEKASIGVKAGLNMAKIKFEDDEENDAAKNRSGFNAGLFVAKPISANVGVRAEANFSQQGVKIEANGEEATYNLTYVNVPVLLTAGPSSSGTTKFNVFTGPQIGFNTKAELEFDGGTVDFDDEVKSTDFSWVLGFGLESGRWLADVRYALGLAIVAESGDNA